MRAIVILLAFLACVGCGETQYEKNARMKREARSAVWTVSRRLANEERDADGWLRRPNLFDFDPWGEPLRVEYERSGAVERVIVTSNGPDRLPGTDDDIAQAASTINDVLRDRMERDKFEKRQMEEQARQKARLEWEKAAPARKVLREAAIEGATGAATKGLIDGVKKGIKGER